MIRTATRYVHQQLHSYEASLWFKMARRYLKSFDLVLQRSRLLSYWNPKFKIVWNVDLLKLFPLFFLWTNYSIISCVQFFKVTQLFQDLTPCLIANFIQYHNFYLRFVIISSTRQKMFHSVHRTSDDVRVNLRD